MTKRGAVNRVPEYTSIIQKGLLTTASRDQVEVGVDGVTPHDALIIHPRPVPPLVEPHLYAASLRRTE